MSVLSIAKMGHPVLRQRAAPVADPTTPEIRALVTDMLDTMRAAPGVGLAAPQVFVSQRVIVFHAPPDRAGGSATPETVLINPELTPLDDGDWALGLEGCLSAPGLRGLVPRHRWIGVRGLDLAGGAVEFEARDFLARVIQHEADHLDGHLYLDRLDDPRWLATEENVQHLLAAARAAFGANDEEGGDA